MEQDKKYCMTCGTELTPQNSKGARAKWFLEGKLPWCVDCQNGRFKSIERDTGNKNMAMYAMSVITDSPFYPELSDKEEDWKSYLLKEKDLGLIRNAETKEYIGFGGAGKSKAKDVLVYFGKKDITKEEIDIQTARTRWGCKFSEDGVAVEYSDTEIEELESLYKEQAAEYKGSVTTRVDMSIREICINRLEWKRCVGTGDSAGAKRFADMIKDAMAREGMRAGDSKPLEATRIDSLIVNLEKKGAIKNHKIVGREELIDILAKDHPKYHTSLDVVDAMIMATINTMRRNNGEGELDTLPKPAQVDDVFDELEKEPTERERNSMSELGIVPPVREV